MATEFGYNPKGKWKRTDLAFGEEDWGKRRFAEVGGYPVERFEPVFYDWRRYPSKEGGGGVVKPTGQSPKWDDPMLGPGQIPPGEPGANPELRSGESESDYISRVVWPMFGGKDAIDYGDLPGVLHWRQGREPWQDPRVPWPSNVPKSIGRGYRIGGEDHGPLTKEGTSIDSGAGYPSVGVSEPETVTPLPRGARKAPLRQGREEEPERNKPRSNRNKGAFNRYMRNLMSIV